MMTLSKSIPTVLFALFSVLGMAQEAEVFNRNAEAVLAGKLLAADGLHFGVARVVPEDDSVLEESIAKQQAILLASVHLLCRLAVERIVWPETLSERDQIALADFLTARLRLSATLKGLQTVAEIREGNAFVAVVALSEPAASAVPRLTFPEARAFLLEEEHWFDPTAPLDALLALHATQAPLPKAIDRTPWQSALDTATFPTPRLRALPRLAGRAPIGTAQPPSDSDFAMGQAAYARGELHSAYGAFLASAEHIWSYDALNMAGNVARRLGKNAEAVPLLLHAAYLCPTSPHPWVHLAFVAEALGSPTLAGHCCHAAETRSPDAWTIAQLNRLRKTMESEPNSEAPHTERPSPP